MNNRKGLDGLAVALMLILCVIWGLQQTVLKIAAPDIAPVLLIALRSGIAAVLVAMLMCWRKEPVTLADGAWRPGLVVGCLFALEFLLVGQALQFTSASHAVVFLYTAPIFAALGLHLKLPAERLGRLQWLGIGLAFAGIAWAFLWPNHAGNADAGGHSLLGDGLALLGGIAWAATTVVVRTSRLATASASQTLLYQLVAGFVLLLIAAAVLGQTKVNPTPLMWSSLVFQALIVSFASFLVWFWLLRNYLASQLGVFSFLTPLFGVAFGVGLLNEPLEFSFLVGAALVLVGVVLVSGQGWLQTQWQRLRKTQT